MAYTTINKPSEYFNTVTWSGNSSNPRNITGVGFQPDLVWGKIRSAGGNYYAIDVVRGSGTGTLNTLNTDDYTAAEQTNTSGGSTSFGVYTSFDSDGFTVNAGSSSAKNTNETGQTYVAWNWLGGGTGVSNTDGSITSTVSANTTSGFSIVTWSGTSSNGTIGHGLGVAPKVIICFGYSSGGNSWTVGHNSLSWNHIIYLETGAASTVSNSAFWQNTAPTNDVFSVGSFSGTNSSQSMIAYCFAEKKGFSKFGSYVGNGNADGTFVYTGFKPAWVMVKKSSASGDNWSILDNKRNTFNVMDKYLDPNSSNAEGTADIWDFTSSGFKMRNTLFRL
jgi:hypothetical protein